MIGYQRDILERQSLSETKMAEVLKDCEVLHKQHKDLPKVCSVSHWLRSADVLYPDGTVSAGCQRAPTSWPPPVQSLKRSYIRGNSWSNHWRDSVRVSGVTARIILETCFLIFMISDLFLLRLCFIVFELVLNHQMELSVELSDLSCVCKTTWT